jgi:hypothetical protein
MKKEKTKEQLTDELAACRKDSKGKLHLNRFREQA